MNNTNFLNLEEIAQRLIEIQLQSGLTAKEFCEKTDISTSTFSQIKSGGTKINVDTINKVIQHWGQEVSPMWFLFGESPNSSKDHCNDSANFESGDLQQWKDALLRGAEEIGRLKEALAQKRPKEIERITIFYTDNSVAHYKLIE